jgi:DNA-binding protein HU-beta
VTTWKKAARRLDGSALVDIHKIRQNSVSSRSRASTHRASKEFATRVTPTQLVARWYLHFVVVSTQIDGHGTPIPRKQGIAMTKADLLAAVAAKANVPSAEADRVIQAFVDLVVESAKKGDKVSWPGFGSFSTSKRQARTGRNPRTGEPVQIAASTAMKFSPSSTLKAELNPNR